MDPDMPGPTALCVTNPAARDAHRWASDVPGGPAAKAVVSAHDEARFWCRQCDVRDECLAFALVEEGRNDERDRLGVYGGLGPSERAAQAGRTPKPVKRVPDSRRHERIARLAELLTVGCPKCGRGPGERCRSSVMKRTEPHQARMEALEASNGPAKEAVA